MGTKVGAKLGGLLGGFAQKGLGRLFGMGEYKEGLASELGVDATSIAEGGSPDVNSLVSPVSSNAVPQMHMSEGCVRVVRREFIAPILIQTNGLTNTYRINPGRRVFPWLYSMARNFQQFQFLGFAAEYVPTSGNAVSSTNAALGQVAMAFAYNTILTQNGTQWPITELTGLLNMAGAVSCSPAAPGACYMECDPAMSNQPVRFVWTEGEGSDFSLFYSEQNLDSAIFLIRTEGAQNATPFQAGQLWFTYEVVLMQPRPQDPFPSPSDNAYHEAQREWGALTNHALQLSDVQAIRVTERIKLLETVFASAKYRDYMALDTAKRQMRRLCEEKEPPVIQPMVAELIQDAAVVGERLFPPPPPLSLRRHRLSPPPG
jgi:hypothetical protein